MPVIVLLQVVCRVQEEWEILNSPRPSTIERCNHLRRRCTPIIKEFIGNFAGRAIYSLLDIFVGFDNHILHPDSRDITAFMSLDHGLLRLTVLPQGATNSVPEFQACMSFILQDEILKKVGVFIDDVGIKGGRTRYELLGGGYEMMQESVTRE